MRDALKIRLAHGSEAERRTAANLLRLSRRFDLRPWTWTADIAVDESAHPHSHPRLTLDAHHEDLMLLAEFVHEQLHWFEESRAESRDQAIEATRDLFPDVVSLRPDGAGSEASTRLHLLVCRLEHVALCHLCGPEAARATIETLARHHYRWVYRRVLEMPAALDGLLRSHGLWPDVLAASRK